ncbi:hypothetical protein POJ06DRAFT_142305 [Lipomyces tetrasporus]|uniref:Transcription initiation factor IIF subunit alpha n=1 Tax=Lipomyces tetrasporus TaxID=54092 RepID=A0AAD7QS57_9ASCO|nr:uncharacterized protein POJ06DRAFT_142305 [Lipomyces tetrasporus]KAJ8098792.1 hypothetical protein POJ06DRAFT_142305 [Lipomyces tetrasporus]
MSNILRPSSRSATPSTRPTPRATQIKSENSGSGTPGTPSSTGSTAQKHKYTDYRLRSYSPDEKADKRFHVMKFYSRQNIDPTEFQQPVTMHRKDPRVLRYQAQQKEAEPNGDVKKEEENVDKMEDVKSELDKVAPEPEASVAPDGQRRSKKHGFQKKTRQVYAGDVNQKKLRYEEYYPWLVEDFDGKNTWVGNYEAAQSDCYVLFVFDEDGFKMVPAEKWYKFTPRNKYATLSLDEAEAMMAKKSQPPRWLMKHLHPENEDDQVAQPTRKRLRTVDSQQRAIRKREDDDADELDFDEEFADDEEAPIMEGPEDESKEVEQRVKRQMMVKEEDIGNENAHVDRDRKIGEEGRKLKQSLRSLEKNAIYDTDDEEEEDPFSVDALF